MDNAVHVHCTEKLVLCREVTHVCCKNLTEHINTLYGNMRFSNVSLAVCGSGQLRAVFMLGLNTISPSTRRRCVKQILKLNLQVCHPHLSPLYWDIAANLRISSELLTALK